MCVRVVVWLCGCVWLCVRVCVRVCMCVRACACVYVCACMWWCVYVCAPVCKCLTVAFARVPRAFSFFKQLKLFSSLSPHSHTYTLSFLHLFCSPFQSPPSPKHLSLSRNKRPPRCKKRLSAEGKNAASWANPSEQASKKTHQSQAALQTTHSSP